MDYEGGGVVSYGVGGGGLFWGVFVVGWGWVGWVVCG